MDPDCVALFDALGKRKSAQDVKPLIKPSTATAHDIYYGMSPLFWALSYGHPFDVISEILKANPEAASEKWEVEGYTPLHYIENMDLQSLKLLLEKCPSSAAEKDNKGMTPLHWAAEQAVEAELVEVLVAANKKASTEQDNLGRLPYELAVDNDASQAVLSIIARANPLASMSTQVLPIGILLPGAGSQYVKMLSAVSDVPEVKDLLDEAVSILGYDILDICVNGPEERFQDVAVIQVAIYVANLAAVEILRKERPEAVYNCQAVCGLSLGEISALAVAGVFSFGDGLRLILKRSEAMKEAMNQRAGAMCSVAGLAEKKVLEVCKNASEAAGPDEFCTITNFLFEKGCTIGGTQAAVEHSEKLCKKAKAMQARLLKGGAWHTSLMEPAREKYLKALEEMLPNMNSPRCKVFMNVTGQPITSRTEPAKIIELMGDQLTNPVKWKDCVQNMIKDGVEQFYECGPMKQLKAVMKRIDADAFNQTQNIEV
jgi:[acyl-carrier-protein] S-malonyltransferase